MTKTASAHWEGSIKEGKGTISTQSGALRNQPYSFKKRFGDEAGTNPEELIGAAHAGCFTMAFSGELFKAGITAKAIDSEAQVTLVKDGEGFKVSKSHLIVTIDAGGADQAKVKAAAESAKANCPISKLLNAEVSMDFRISESKAA
ncbi:MAG: OsmC family protein [Bdellovibrionota bacterium]